MLRFYAGMTDAQIADGEAGSAVVYVFADDAAAAIAVPELDTAWRGGELVNFGDDPLPISDLRDVQSVTQIGPAAS